MVVVCLERATEGSGVRYRFLGNALCVGGADDEVGLQARVMCVRGRVSFSKQYLYPSAVVLVFWK